MSLSAERQRLLEQLIRQGASANPGVATQPESRIEPASFAQRRLWFLEQLQQAEVPYTLHAVQHLQFAVDAPLLERVINQVVARHEVLRVGFQARDGEPMQHVEREVHVPLNLVDLTSVPASGRHEEARNRMAVSVARRFDLAKPPLVRFDLYRLAEQECVLLFAVHHIVFDGPSFHAFFKELETLYRDALSGQQTALPPVATQYPQFARAQRAKLTPQRIADELNFWRAELDSVPMLDLPADRPRSATPTFRGSTKLVNLPAPLVARLQQRAANARTSLFTVTLAGLCAAFSRLSGQQDFAIGLPVTGRDSADRQDAIGFFVDTVVVRARLQDNPTTSELIQRTHASLQRSLAHASLPFEMLVEHLRPVRSFGVNPFFQVGYQLMLQPAHTGESHGFEIARSSAMFDVGLDLWMQDTGIGGRVQFNTDLFDESTIDLILAVFQRALEWIAEPDGTLSGLSISAGDLGRAPAILRGERIELPEASCIEVIARMAETHPDLPAVEGSMNGQAASLSYRELTSQVDRWALAMTKRGVTRGGVVALEIARSLDLTVLQLSAMRLGAAFLSLDPCMPAVRRTAILERSKPQLMIDREMLAAMRDEEVSGSSSDGPVRDNAAYVIFTSGSTGEPKGVPVSHAGLLNIVHAQRRLFGVGPGRRVAQLASPTFDASVFETVLALCAGATLVVTPAEVLAGVELARFIEVNRVDTLVLPPSLLATLKPADCPALRLVCVAGESCPADLASAWQDRCEFWNLYGPTETSIWATFGRTLKAARVSIGRPIANVTTLVVGDDLRALPVGVPGKLCIAGVTVAPGYLHEGELTAQRFLPGIPDCAEPVYLTGDVVRQSADGELLFLGRADRQLKIRGFRIEPEEIECVLRSHLQVSDAVVDARAQEGGERVLVAYLQSAAPHEQLVEECRKLVRTALPRYALPSHFLVLEEFPRSPGGKLDLRALPAPAELAAPADSFVAPSTPAEEQIAALMASAVHAPRLGATDDFFRVGGHSLAAAHLVSRIRAAFKADVTIRDVFVHPTVAALATRVLELQQQAAASGMDDEVPLVRLPRHGELPAAPARMS